MEGSDSVLIQRGQDVITVFQADSKRELLEQMGEGFAGRIELGTKVDTVWRAFGVSLCFANQSPYSISVLCDIAGIEPKVLQIATNGLVFVAFNKSVVIIDPNEIEVVATFDYESPVFDLSYYEIEKIVVAVFETGVKAISFDTGKAVWELATDVIESWNINNGVFHFKEMDGIKRSVRIVDGTED